MKYKVIQDRVIIDVLDGLTYVKQYKNGLILPCTLNKGPMGIMSNSGSVIWHLEGLADFKSGNYATVSIAEITDEEYNELKTALGTDEELTEPPPEDAPGEDNTTDTTLEDETEQTPDNTPVEDNSQEEVATTEPVMSIAAMRQEILELKAKVATLTAENEALTAYHETVSDASVNSIAKIRAVSSQTATDISAIKGVNAEEVS